jgi:hypothetical protein
MKELLLKYKLYVIGFVICAVLWFGINALVAKNAQLNKKLEVATYNAKVAQDSLKIVKDKVGKDETDKLAYLTNTVDNLVKLNQELAQEVKNIKGTVNTVIKSDIKVVEKPVPFLVQGQLIDSNVVARFKYDSIYSLGNFRKLSGYTSFNLKTGKVSGQKEQDEFGIRFTTGIKNLDKGTPEIFIKSDYPGFQVTSLEGAVLDPKLFKPKTKTPLITPSITIGWTPIIWSSKDQIVRTSFTDFGVTAGLGFNILKLTKLKK